MVNGRCEAYRNDCFQEFTFQESDDRFSDGSIQHVHVHKNASRSFAVDSNIGSAPQTTANLVLKKHEQVGVCPMALLKRYFQVLSTSI